MKTGFPAPLSETWAGHIRDSPLPSPSYCSWGGVSSAMLSSPLTYRDFTFCVCTQWVCERGFRGALWVSCGQVSDWEKQHFTACCLSVMRHVEVCFNVMHQMDYTARKYSYFWFKTTLPQSVYTKCNFLIWDFIQCMDI